MNRTSEALAHAVLVSTVGFCPWQPSNSPSVTGHDMNGDNNGPNYEAFCEGFNAIITGKWPERGLESLRQSSLLHALLPNVVHIVGFGGLSEGHKDLWEHTKQVVKQAPNSRTIRIAALYHDAGKPFAFKRDAKGEVSFHNHEQLSGRAFMKDAHLRKDIFSNYEENVEIQRLISGLGQVEAYRPDWTDSAVRRLFIDYEDIWNELCALACSDVTSAHADRRARARNRTQELRDRALKLSSEEKRIASTRLPKGTGLQVERLRGVTGARLGEYMRFMQGEIDNGRLAVYVKPEQYDDWIVTNDPPPT